MLKSAKSKNDTKELLTGNGEGESRPTLGHSLVAIYFTFHIESLTNRGIFVIKLGKGCSNQNVSASTLGER